MFETLFFKALLDSFDMIHILLLPWRHINLVPLRGTKLDQNLNADKHWNRIMSQFVSLHPPFPIKISSDTPGSYVFNFKSALGNPVSKNVNKNEMGKVRLVVIYDHL